ncbi:NPCBM/NEW2 domain-containing protein [Catellatospora bangladeshensis]|uniref:Glycosyl hydrolase family 98 putative carbohydrate-binding module domain-containing protein n=1 Tax=Catellatospora bangladeshensis TaxID=310355 RepID=A0A8J3JWJ7_9ACTN|nr:NPCBM/NEW2 domain-containing protein [Catellatospora bangladeshensis]GIF86445.1 hypothetical protein Cba03nite_77940 [Catellatospora bangladeshensis]
MTTITPPDAPDPHQAGLDRRWSRLGSWIGLVSGVIGIMTAVVAFPTTLSKALAAIACGAFCGLLWQAARDHERRMLSKGMIGWLSATGLLLLLLIVVLVDGTVPPPGAGAQPEARTAGGQTAGPVTAGPGSSIAAPAQSAAPPASSGPALPAGSVFLHDLPSLSPTERWSFGPRQLLGRDYPRSLTAPGCGFKEDLLAYNLLRRYERFQADIGLADDAQIGSSAEFMLIADDREIYRSPRLKPGEVKPVDVPVKNVFRLSLFVSATCDAEAKAKATWGDARLLA